MFVARKALGRIQQMTEGPQKGRPGYEGDRTATLNVASFNDDVSQLMIAGHAGPGEGSTSSMVVRPCARLQGNEQALRDRQLGRPALQNVERVGATTMSLMQIVGGSFQQ